MKKLLVLIGLIIGVFSVLVFQALDESGPDWNTVFRDGSFVVFQEVSDNSWVKVVEDEFSVEYETHEYVLPPHEGTLKFQMMQRGLPFAGLEFVSVESCGEQLSLDYAKMVNTGELVMDEVQNDDFDVVIVHENPIFLQFLGSSPCNEGALLKIKANEYGQSIPYNTRDNDRVFAYELGSRIQTITLDGAIDEVDGIYEADEKLFWESGTGHPDGHVFIYVSEDEEYVHFSFDLTIDNTQEFGEDWIEITLIDDAGDKIYYVDDYEDQYGLCGFGLTSKVLYKHQTCEIQVPKDDLDPALTSLTYALRYYGTAAPPAEFYRDPLLSFDYIDPFYDGEVMSNYEASGVFLPAYSETSGSPRDNLSAGGTASNPDVAQFMANNGLDHFLGYGEERSASSNGYDLYVQVRGNVNDAPTWTSPILSASGDAGGASPYSFSQIHNMIPDYQDEGLYVLFEEGAEGGPIPSPYGSTELIHLNDNTGAIDWQVSFNWQSVSIAPDGNDGIYVLRDSGPQFDGSGSSSVGILEHYTPAGKDMTFGGTGSVVVSNDTISNKGGATLVTYLDAGFSFDDVFVLWADDDAVNPGLYARRFDETGAAHASFTNPRGKLVVPVTNIDIGYFQDFPGLYQIHAESNPVIAESIVVGAAILDGELSAFSFDGDGVNSFPCFYNQVSPNFDQFDVVMQYGISGGDKGAYLIWQDGNDLNMSLINESGESYWAVGGHTIFSSPSIEVTLKSPGFLTNARGRYEGTSAVLDTSTNGGTLIYGSGGVGFTQYDFDESNFPSGPGGDCTAAVPVPDAPVISAVAGNGQLQVDFNAPADNGSALTQYEIRVGEKVGFPGNEVTTIEVAGADPVSVIVTGLTNETEYSVRVFATNAGGLSAASNVVDVTPTSPSGNRRRVGAINQSPQIFLGSLQTAVTNVLKEYHSFHGSADSDQARQLYQQVTGTEGAFDGRFQDNEELRERVGADREGLLSLLDLIVQLRSLYGWMQHEDYQLTSGYERAADVKQEVFLTRFFHQLVGVEYLKRGQVKALDFEYRDPIFEPTRIVVDFEKSLMLSFGKACYDDAVMDYVQEVDFPGSANWFFRYREYMKPLTDILLQKSEYVPWHEVDESVEDVLGALYLYLFGFCLTQ